MSDESVEQMCRNLLKQAIEDLLVLPNNDWRDPSPQSRTSGELVGMANLLAEYLATKPREQ